MGCRSSAGLGIDEVWIVMLGLKKQLIRELALLSVTQPDGYPLLSGGEDGKELLPALKLAFQDPESADIWKELRRLQDVCKQTPWEDEEEAKEIVGDAWWLSRWTRWKDRWEGFSASMTIAMNQLNQAFGNLPVRALDGKTSTVAQSIACFYQTNATSLPELTEDGVLVQVQRDKRCRFVVSLQEPSAVALLIQDESTSVVRVLYPVGDGDLVLLPKGEHYLFDYRFKTSGQYKCVVLYNSSTWKDSIEQDWPADCIGDNWPEETLSELVSLLGESTVSLQSTCILVDVSE